MDAVMSFQSMPVRIVSLCLEEASALVKNKSEDPLQSRVQTSVDTVFGKLSDNFGAYKDWNLPKDQMQSKCLGRLFSIKDQSILERALAMYVVHQLVHDERFTQFQNDAKSIYWKQLTSYLFSSKGIAGAYLIYYGITSYLNAKVEEETFKPDYFLLTEYFKGKFLFIG